MPPYRPRVNYQPAVYCYALNTDHYIQTNMLNTACMHISTFFEDSKYNYFVFIYICKTYNKKQLLIYNKHEYVLIMKISYFFRVQIQKWGVEQTIIVGTIAHNIPLGVSADRGTDIMRGL